MPWEVLQKKNLNVPEKPKLKCLGFTYNGAKLFNMLPIQMKKTENPHTFKNMTKIGYGKTSLHISHQNLFQTFSISSAILQLSLKYVLWIIANKLN